MAAQLKHLSKEGFKTTFLLAAPLSLAFAGEQLFGFVDVLVAGHLGVSSLAAIGLSNAIFMSAVIVGMGLLSGIEPIVAQARGRENHALIQRFLKSRTRLTLALTPMVIVLSELILFLYFWAAELEPSLKSEMRSYIFARYLSVPALLHLSASRALLQAFEKPGAVFKATLYANLFNLPLNLFLATDLSWAVSPMTIQCLDLGVVGLGLATTVVSVFRAKYLSLHVQRWRTAEADVMNRNDWGLLKRIGLPIGIHWLAEMLIFSMVGLLSGHLGTNQAAAHQIAMSIASFTFTLCLGLSSAGTVRVGLALGLNDAQRARREGLRSTTLAMGMMSLSALCFFLFPRQLATLFSTDESVVDVASKLVTIAAAFQIVDGLQAVMAGNLRGLGASRWAFKYAAFGYWCVGFPLSVWLSTVFGTVGLWYGLVAGLTVSALLQSWGFIKALKPPHFEKWRQELD